MMIESPEFVAALKRLAALGAKSTYRLGELTVTWCHTPSSPTNVASWGGKHDRHLDLTGDDLGALAAQAKQAILTDRTEEA
jgi:hypothetical protein